VNFFDRNLHLKWTFFNLSPRGTKPCGLGQLDIRTRQL